MPTSALNRLPFFRIIPALLVILTTLMLGACSMVRLGYEQLPSLAYWWVDSYVDLNDGQSVALRRDLAALHYWHRTQELPRLANLLAELRTQALQDTTPQQTCQIFDQFKERLQAVLTQAEPALTTLVRQLTPAQQKYLIHQLGKREQTWREEWVEISPAKFVERRTERLTDYSESFYGHLSEPQLALLATNVSATSYDVKLAETEVQQRQQDVQHMLRAIAQDADNTTQVQARLHALLQRMMDSPNPAYRAQSAQFTRANCTALAQLHNSASPAQRQQLAAKLQAYELDLRTLAAAR
jgi:hypothetical protein